MHLVNAANRSDGKSAVIVVEIGVDRFGHLFGYAINGEQVGEGGAADGLCRAAAEMMQQGAFAGRSDAWNILKPGLGNGLRAAGPVGADGKAVGLVAQAAG